MNIELYTLFFFTTVLLIAVPGPSAMVASSQGARLQSKKSLVGVLGIASADAIFFALSATGIATIIIASSSVFSAIKWLGVLFLLYLGFTILLSKGSAIKLGGKQTQVKTVNLFSQGLFIQLANPKALMYFSALLPQFIDPNKDLMPQIIIMGITCFIADILVYSLYAYLGAHLAKQKLKSWVIQLINKSAGIALIFTGIRMAMLDNKTV